MKKRILSILITVVMLIGMLPITAFAADSVSRMPGARVETNTSGDVFLGGNYIEVGISKHGSFGTSTGPKTEGWHKPSSQSGIGLLSDEDGWNVGEPSATGDFFLPGTKEERWILAYKKDGSTYEHHIADRNNGAMGSWLEEPRAVDASDLANGKLKAIVTGITNQNVKIVITYSFDVNDLFYTTDVEIINVGTSAIEDVRFVRSFDPDQDADMHGEYETYNKVICNPVSDRPGGTDNYALVVARGGETLSGYFFLAFDNRARASWAEPLSPGSAYSSFLWDTASVTEKTFATDEAVAMDKSNRNGYTLEDGLIALTFNIGSLSANGSTTLQYMSSLDPDVQGSLQKVLSGQVDYTEEVLTGFTVGSNYHITCDGVTYVFENVPASTIPLVGTAPTTADPASAVAYDFLGKTITVVEVDELGETVSEEQELTIASRPGEVRPGEILPDVPAPVIENITTTLNGITIDPAVEIQEYSLDGQNWISPTDGKILFTGLEDGTGYTVYSRVAATSEYPASQICSLLVYTDAYKVILNYGALGSEVTYAQASGKLDLDIPVFDGYIFMGWYTDEDFNTTFDFDNPITATTTVYAKFADYEGDKEALNNKIDAAKAELQGKIDAVESALAGKADAATLAQAITDLNTAKTNIQTLLEQIDDYEDADTALKAELKGYIDDADEVLKISIDELDGRVDDIEDALDGIDLSQIATNKQDIIDLTTELGNLDDLVNTINTNYASADANLQTQITALDTRLTELIDETIAELTDSVNKLKDDLNTANGKIDTNTGDITTLKTNVSTLKTWKNEAQAAIEAMQTLTGTQSTNISALQTAVANLQNAVNTANDKITATENRIAVLEGKVSALETAKTNLENAVSALQTAVADKADTATVNAAIAELQTAITALEAVKDNYATADATLKTELEGKIANAQTAAIFAAETLVNNAKADLQSKIDAKADAATTTVAIQNLQAAVAALEAVKDDYATADATLKTELEDKIETAKSEAITAANTALTTAKNELSQAIALKADTATLNAKVDALNTAIANAESVAKAYADTQDAALKAELQTAIANAKSESIGAAQLLVDNAKAELQTAIDTKADTATVNAAIANLQNAITALEAAKDNYASAYAALKLELEAAIERAKQEAIEASKGYIPYIGTNGNWWIGDTDTGVDANGIKGDTGATGNGIASITTSKANGITTVTIKFTDPNMADVIFTIEDGTDGAKGDKGKTGAQGAQGEKGDKGDKGDTGAQGEKGEKGNTGAAGADGVGIANIEKTSSDGNVDTYTITLTNGTTYTFTVTNGTNGTDGKDGKDGVDGMDGTNGTNGVDGKDGTDGEDGQTPYIGENGNWWIGDTDTGVKAVAEDGKDGAVIIATAVGGTALASNIALILWLLLKKKALF